MLGIYVGNTEVSLTILQNININKQITAKEENKAALQCFLMCSELYSCVDNFWVNHFNCGGN